MERADIQKAKKKYRVNYLTRLCLSLVTLPIFYYYNLDLALILCAGLHIGITLAWAVLVETEARISFNENLRYLRIFLDEVYIGIIILCSGGPGSFVLLDLALLTAISSLYVNRGYGVFSVISGILVYNVIIGLIYFNILPAINIFSDELYIKPNFNIGNIIITNFTLSFGTLLMYFIVNTTYRGMVSKTSELEEKTAELQNERNKLKQRNESIEMELSLARKIQDQLIPAEQGSDYVYSFYKPMDQVGGDFTDFIRFTNSDNLGIFVSDVSGHGVPAAFITSMIKTTILQSGNRVEDPAALLLYMNEMLQNQTAGNFITAFYGIYDPHTRTLRYANAGHPQPYVITAKGVVQLQEGKNTALAMFSNNMLERSNKTYVNYEETLPTGSKLLLYTDGLIEARPLDDRDIFFEYADMLGVLLQHKKETCRSFINIVYRKLVDFRGSDSFDDDVCMICLDVG